jgi:hypothetical protein
VSAGSGAKLAAAGNGVSGKVTDGAANEAIAESARAAAHWGKQVRSARTHLATLEGRIAKHLAKLEGRP